MELKKNSRQNIKVVIKLRYGSITLQRRRDNLNYTIKNRQEFTLS